MWNILICQPLVTAVRNFFENVYSEKTSLYITVCMNSVILNIRQKACYLLWVSYSSIRLFPGERFLNWSVANNNSTEENTWQQIFFAGKGSTNRIQIPGVGGTMQFPNKSRRGRCGSAASISYRAVAVSQSRRVDVAPPPTRRLSSLLFYFFQWQPINIWIVSSE